MKQASSPFSIVINVSWSVSVVKYSPVVTREVRISFDIFESISNMGRTDITDIVDKGKLLRVAECSVENVKQARFEQVLKDAGNRGMIPGMLSGAFGKRQNGRYMDASLCDNEDSHQRYADKELPALIKESGVKDSTQRISVSLIELHPKWAVI
ncbi:hypothetical protein [Peribacillus frigoritolerans]|uniref:hypothetical protein n=1 Tax=Peribacillus frigoritolerans TaxID=450367 RepID=UPI003391C9DD